MDRVIMYPGQVPAVEDALQAQKNALLGIGRLIEAVMGQVTIAAGFAASISSGGTLTLTPGSLTVPGTMDATAYGVLGTDATAITKQGTLNTPTVLALGGNTPGTSGQSVNILVQAATADADGNDIVLDYFNTASPTTPYNGAAGSGTSQPTARACAVTISTVIGTAAATGSQTTPAATGGASPLYVVTLPYGAAPSVAMHSAAPFLPFTLPQLTPGFSRRVKLTSSQTWAAPFGVTRVKVTLRGGGGGGGGTSGNGTIAGAGAGGDCVTDITTVVPGTGYAAVVGTGGAGGAATGANGTAGGLSSFNGLIAAGGGGGLGTTTAGVQVAGGAPGTGSNGADITPGIAGGPGSVDGSTYVGGNGGGGGLGSGSIGPNKSSATTPQGGSAGSYPSGGGNGGISGGAGGSGQNGSVILEY